MRAVEACSVTVRLGVSGHGLARHDKGGIPVERPGFCAWRGVTLALDRTEKAMAEGKDIVKRVHKVLTRAHVTLHDLTTEASYCGEPGVFTEVKAASDAVEAAYLRMSRYRWSGRS